MKRELIVGAVALGAGVVAALFAQDVVDRYDLRPANDSIVAPSSPSDPSSPGDGAQPEPTKKPNQNKAPKPPKKAQQMTVTWIYDGDTIQAQAKKPGRYVNVTGKIDIRLIGVDSPEMKPKPECYAKKATNFLKDLLPVGTKILVAPDKDSWDDFKRRLFYVWKKKGKVFVEYEIARTGHAPAIRVWPNVSHYEVLKKIQDKAQKAERGLWGKC